MPTKTLPRSEIAVLIRSLATQFSTELEALGPSLKKKAREDMCAGFTDGCRSMLLILESKGYLDVDRSEAPGAATPVAPTSVEG